MENYQEYIEKLRNTSGISVTRFSLSLGDYEDYVEIYSKEYNLRLLLHFEEGEIYVLERFGWKVVNEMLIATRCTLNDYTRIVESLMRVKIGDKLK